MASLKVREIPSDLAKFRRTAKGITAQLEVAKTEHEKGRGWTPEKETSFQELQDRAVTLDAEIAKESELAREEREQRASSAEGKIKVGKFFSVGDGIQATFAVDTAVREEAEGIVRTIFPAVKGVYFSDALYGHGPELAASQKAAGLPVTEASEVAGRMERAAAIVEISLSGKFDPIKTAYHEAYHLARMLLTPQEKAVLMDAYASEESEAYGFDSWLSGKPAGVGIIQQAWVKLRELFRALGNLLRGRGYNTVDKIFDRITIGNVGTRAAQAEMEGTAYSATREEKYLDSTNRTLNEVTPEHEPLVEAATGGKRSSPRIKLEWLWQKMNENLYSEEYLKKLYDHQPSMDKGQLAVEALAWRKLNHFSRVTAHDAAQVIKDQHEAGKTPTEESLLEFDQSIKAMVETWKRSNAFTANIGRALRVFAEPLEPELKQIDKLRDMHRSVVNGLDLEPEVVAGVKIDPELLHELLSQISAGNEHFGTASEADGKETMADYLKGMIDGEIESLTDHWRANPKALVDLVDAVLLEDIKAAGDWKPKISQSAWLTKLMWLYYGNILSGPMTLARNGISGAFMYAFATPVEELMQAAMPIKGTMTMKEWRAGMSPSTFPGGRQSCRRGILGSADDRRNRRSRVVRAERRDRSEVCLGQRAHPVSIGVRSRAGTEARPGRDQPMGGGSLAHGDRCGRQEAGLQTVCQTTGLCFASEAQDSKAAQEKRANPRVLHALLYREATEDLHADGA